MKAQVYIVFFSGMMFFSVFQLQGQTIEDGKAIIDLVARYAEARDKADTVLLKSIITEDMDQLVSSGEWRYGMDAAVKGMIGSSQDNPGERILKVERVRYLSEQTGLADARYTIKNEDGSERKMWSTFVAVKKGKNWKIAAIRNMLPAGN
ncbi:MAG: DUF4440 domain-containing protein [Cyclobacterium sp.]|uniref:DUF4440 domain-containing protein n=1 Tax=unclassified Cyclobacterium TaxID=2615055 RepID=UPI0013D36EBC|nr:DUF4440 domain-containing protein [Cyclobacterium sp. SYSU L10401]